MNDVKLNLARKWRSKQFNEIIGQELPVRMLKNSLYRDHYFPVYLFSGQRGCGKTTTARVFAAAVNCEQLSEFQKNPKSCTLPCLHCKSCAAMAAGKHPDFIEIDAASHTGVDNVRAIIESSSLLPLMGSKKIYLIDEAHMLSKAAFNALLKIMEEPPASVLFILATTDAQKIIETVKSRCFQLFFDPVAADYLLNHLIAVCQKENIRFDTDGLELIIKQTEGSVRDALNMVEQVRFASSMITKDGVLSVLGHLDDERLLELAQLVIACKPKQLLLFLQQNRIVDYRAEYIWSRLMALIHALLWTKYGVRPDEFISYQDELQQLARSASIARLHAILATFSQNELLFSRTTAQHSFLEMILLQLCFDASQSNNEGSSSPLTSQNAAPSASSEVNEYFEDEDESTDDDENEEGESDDFEEETITQEDGYVFAWKNFLRDLVQLDDPILVSIFQQGVFHKVEGQQLLISFAKDLSFFHETIMGAQQAWKPLLTAAFKIEFHFVPVYDREKVPSSTVQITKPVVVQKVAASSTKPVQQVQGNNVTEKPQQKFFQSNNRKFGDPFAKVAKPRGTICDVSDKGVWIKAHVLMNNFPGTVYELARPNFVEPIQHMESMQ